MAVLRYRRLRQGVPAGRRRRGAGHRRDPRAARPDLGDDRVVTFDQAATVVTDLGEALDRLPLARQRESSPARGRNRSRRRARVWTSMGSSGRSTAPGTSTSGRRSWPSLRNPSTGCAAHDAPASPTRCARAPHVAEDLLDARATAIHTPRTTGWLDSSGDESTSAASRSGRQDRRAGPMARPTLLHPRANVRMESRAPAGGGERGSVLMEKPIRLRILGSLAVAAALALPTGSAMAAAPGPMRVHVHRR